MCSQWQVRAAGQGGRPGVETPNQSDAPSLFSSGRDSGIMRCGTYACAALQRFYTLVSRAIALRAARTACRVMYVRLVPMVYGVRDHVKFKVACFVFVGILWCVCFHVAISAVLYCI